MSVNDPNNPQSAQYGQPGQYHQPGQYLDYGQHSQPHHYGPPAYTAPGSLAPQESFTTKAIVTLVLYFVMWLPGLIANLVFWNEAKKVKDRSAGQAPEGYGCLVAMLIVQLAGIGVLCLFFGLTLLGTTAQ